MTEDREPILSRTPYRVVLWLVISIVYDAPGFIFVSGSGWNSNQIIRYSIAELSSSALLGVLFFLGASLFLSSRYTRFKEESDNRELVKSFIIFLFLTTMYLMCRSVFVMNAFVRFGEVGASVDVAFIYGALLTAPVISFIYCSLAAGLAIIVDDWRLTVTIGCGLFLVTNFLGMPFATAYHPEISLFSPTHFYRAVLLIFSDLFVTLPLPIKAWGGLISVYYLMAPLIAYTILTGLSIWAFRNFGAENIRRNKLLVKFDTIQVTKQEQIEDTTLEKQLKARRKAVLVCFLVFGLLIPMGGYTYTSSIELEKITVIYENVIHPTNGELFYGIFTTEVPPPAVSRCIQFPLDILDWGQCSSPISFEYTFGEGPINDFLELDEEDRWQSSRTIYLEDDQTQYLYSRSSGLDELAGVHYWAFRFYSDDWTEEQGALRIRISVVIIDRPEF
ncbi:MAG: hypothetical protein ACTSVR_06050 [Candidatus Thorarchaeota archaeon]